MIKILVTGSSGMIGFHLLKILSKNKNYKLYAMDKAITSDISNYCFERSEILKKYNNNIQFENVDLCDNTTLERIKFISPDIIVHLAAIAGVSESFKNPQTILLNNNNSFINLLETIRLTKPEIKLLYASSSSVYGKTNGLQIENNIDLQPTSSYGLSKLINEKTAALYFQNYGISSVGLRFFTVYGEYNRKDMLMHHLLDSFKYKKEVSLYHNGLMQRDFTYVGDVVNSIVAFIQSNDTFKYDLFNVGGTGSSTLNEVVCSMQRHFKTSHNIIKNNVIPPYDPLKTFCDNSKLLSIFPHLNFISLDEGIDRLVHWYINDNSNLQCE